MRELQEHIVLGDGTRLSVQASRTHYCSPKDDVGPWTAVEVLIDEGKPCKSWGNHQPYGWVPIRRLESLISRRGGVISGKAWWRNG